MRVLNGGTLTVTPKLLTKKNKITQTVKGTITSLGKVEGATVKIGDAETTLSADGRYSLSCVFDRPVLRMSVSAAGSDAVYETEISIADEMFILMFSVSNTGIYICHTLFCENFFELFVEFSADSVSVILKADINTCFN